MPTQPIHGEYGGDSVEATATWDELIDEYGEEVLAGSSVPTRCPERCFVEPDGVCPHGFASVLIEGGMI